MSFPISQNLSALIILLVLLTMVVSVQPCDIESFDDFAWRDVSSDRVFVNEKYGLCSGRHDGVWIPGYFDINHRTPSCTISTAGKKLLKEGEDVRMYRSKVPVRWKHMGTIRGGVNGKFPCRFVPKGAKDHIVGYTDGMNCWAAWGDDEIVTDNFELMQT
jgi:hypothetical protein